MTFSFSYSRWSCWDECPAKYKYKHIDKLPEPKSKAMEKGIEVHRQVAEYIEGKTDERPASLRLFTGMADALRDEAKHDLCKVEMQVAFDKDRKRVEWFSRNAYWRFIWDVLYINRRKDSLASVDAVDWKTGQPRGSYDAQMQIFAIPAYWMFDNLTTFKGHLVYLDTGDVVTVEYDRAQFYGPSCDPAANDGLYGLWMANVAMMESDRAFRAKPSREACRFCHFHKAKGGPCEQGY